MRDYQVTVCFRLGRDNPAPHVHHSRQTRDSMDSALRHGMWEAFQATDGQLEILIDAVTAVALDLAYIPSVDGAVIDDAFVISAELDAGAAN